MNRCYDNNGGFVLIYRRLLDNPVFRSDAEAMAFAWLVMRAAWRSCTLRYKGHVVMLDRGQLAMSVRDMAERLEWSKDRAFRFLNKLAASDMIATTTAAGVNIITVSKYSDYQNDIAAIATPAARTPRQDRDRHATQNNEWEKEEEEKERNGAATESMMFDAFETVRMPVQTSLLAQPEPQKHGDLEAWKLWNIFADRYGWRKVARLTEIRRDKLRLRLEEVGGIPNWVLVLERAAASDLLGCTGHPPWWDFDFLVRNDTNIQKLLDGKYDRRTNGSGALCGAQGVIQNIYAHRMRDPILNDLAHGLDPGLVEA